MTPFAFTLLLSLRKAAEQGLALAQHNLGNSYYKGEGVSKDKVQAYAWYNLAQANGHQDVKKWRDKLELTPEELAEAQALSTEIHKRIKANEKDTPNP